MATVGKFKYKDIAGLDILSKMIGWPDAFSMFGHFPLISFSCRDRSRFPLIIPTPEAVRSEFESQLLVLDVLQVVMWSDIANLFLPEQS